MYIFRISPTTATDRIPIEIKQDIPIQVYATNKQEQNKYKEAGAKDLNALLEASLDSFNQECTKNQN